MLEEQQYLRRRCKDFKKRRWTRDTTGYRQIEEDSGCLLGECW